MRQEERGETSGDMWHAVVRQGNCGEQQFPVPAILPYNCL